MAAARCLALTLLLATLPVSPRAAAQEFPARPVRSLLPYAAGGSGDVLARLLGNKLSALWGQQVVVDDRPGAGGLIAAQIPPHAAPGARTIYLATDGPLTIAATL